MKDDGPSEGRGGDRAGGRSRLPRGRISRDVADRIAEKIFSGEYPYPGRIDLDAVAAELGVSRVPVREALASLERDGLVQVEFYRGAYVAPLTSAMIQDNFELYGMLTSLAAHRAAELITDGELDGLATTLAAAGQPAIPTEEFFRLAYAFRREVHRIGGTPRLRQLLGSFRTILAAAGRATVGEHRDTGLAGLRAEWESLHARDPEAAAREAFTSMRRTGEEIVAVLRAHGVLREDAVAPDVAARAHPGDFYARVLGGLTTRGLTAG